MQYCMSIILHCIFLKFESQLLYLINTCSSERNRFETAVGHVHRAIQHSWPGGSSSNGFLCSDITGSCHFPLFMLPAVRPSYPTDSYHLHFKEGKASNVVLYFRARSLLASGFGDKDVSLLKGLVSWKQLHLNQLMTDAQRHMVKL